MVLLYITVRLLKSTYHESFVENNEKYQLESGLFLLRRVGIDFKGYFVNNLQRERLNLRLENS